MKIARRGGRGSTVRSYTEWLYRWPPRFGAQDYF